MVYLPPALRLVPARVRSGAPRRDADIRSAYRFEDPGSLHMRIVAARSILFAAFIALTLAGCKTDGTFDLFGSFEQPAPNNNVALNQPPVPQANSFEEQEDAPPVQVAEQPPVYNNPLNNTPRGEALAGNNPADDIKLGKKHYREQNFGIAERHFRRAVEAAPQNLEAWMGLAASYDKLRRFDLADRAYNQAFAIRGATPELLNNHGYSYILRGDYKNARIKLAEAKAKDPNNRYIQNNIDLLDDSIRNAR
jgi:tetratricopeptide (TPR) repeat protein